MANKSAGERVLKHKGDSYTLRLDFRAIAALETEYDCGIVDFTARFLPSGNATVLARTLSELIESAGGEISIEDAGQLLLDYGIFKTTNLISKTFAATLAPEGTAGKVTAPEAT